METVSESGDDSKSDYSGKKTRTSALQSKRATLNGISSDSPLRRGFAISGGVGKPLHSFSSQLRSPNTKRLRPSPKGNGKSRKRGLTTEDESEASKAAASEAVRDALSSNPSAEELRMRLAKECLERAQFELQYESEKSLVQQLEIKVDDYEKKYHEMEKHKLKTSEQIQRYKEHVTSVIESIELRLEEEEAARNCAEDQLYRLGDAEGKLAEKEAVVDALLRKVEEEQDLRLKAVERAISARKATSRIEEEFNSFRLAQMEQEIVSVRRKSQKQTTVDVKDKDDDVRILRNELRKAKEMATERESTLSGIIDDQNEHIHILELQVKELMGKIHDLEKKSTVSPTKTLEGIIKERDLTIQELEGKLHLAEESELSTLEACEMLENHVKELEDEQKKGRSSASEKET